ncbi:hypothetical protein EGI16_14730 [Chryseobacterium sp. G0240]|uniref:hypothetical protein n=1 Tax=Chryseobacterium sp. G0240 TaxID=2487066 RepID=UPI000F450328|nr:hypothetical protein [Chryseobacterium sp. G0240]ROI02134.1 hypothetical protein EGI16_14730 [Chryseobacterium sp. G0240]
MKGKNYLLLMVFFANIVFSQVGIGTANPRGALDINKETTNTMGLVLPTNENPNNLINPMGGNVAIGTIMYDSALSCVRVFKSTGWSNCLCDQCGPTPGFALDCSSGALSGTFTAGAAGSGSKVINYTNATGQSYGAISIASTGVTGLTATAPAGTLANGNGSITLTISGTPSAAGTASFAVTIAGQTCTFNVQVNGNSPSFTLDCSSGAQVGTFTAQAQGVGTKIINYTGASGQSYGSISIASTGVTGLTATAPAGTLTGSGGITLTITGTPSAAGVASFTVSLGGQTCMFTVNVGGQVFRRMNVLGLATEPWYAPLGNNTYASRAMLTSAQNFGQNGTYPTSGFNIISNTSAQGQTLKNLINDNNIDIIIVGYNYNANATSIPILEDFVKNKKGVLIYSEEYQASLSAQLINRICGGTTTLGKIAGSQYDQLTDVNDPILNGPFGDIRGKIIGSDWTGTAYYVRSGTPSGVTVLANRFNDTSTPLMFKHNSLGFIYMGDSGWLGGSATDTRNTIFPIGMNASGVPQTKPWVGNTTSYSGFLYANTIVWAVQYAQTNTDTNYMIP